MSLPEDGLTAKELVDLEDKTRDKLLDLHLKFIELGDFLEPMKQEDSWHSTVAEHMQERLSDACHELDCFRLDFKRTPSFKKESKPMELNQYPDAIAGLRTQVQQVDQRINDTKAELQRQLESSGSFRELESQKEKLYIELEKTRNEFSISKMEFMKKDREQAQ